MILPTLRKFANFASSLLSLALLPGMNALKDRDSLVPLQVVADQQLSHWLFLLGLVIPCYDHTLTLSKEIHYIWNRPKRPSSYWFFLNRYLSLSANITNTIFMFRSADLQVCPMFLFAEKLMILSQMLVMYSILALRVFAMYNRNKSLMLFLSVFGFIAFSFSTWLATTNAQGTSTPPSSLGGEVYGPGSRDFVLPHCANLIYPESANRIAGAWVVVFGLDLLIFGLTLFHGFTHVRGRDRFTLSHRLVRDGALYFVVILLVNLMNILMLVLSRPLLAGSLAWMTSTVSAAMVSRIMLSLHKAADTGIGTTTDESVVRFRRSSATELSWIP
ncbi:hypothetical protein C8J57DRAFT_256642 [Mycena rebaudengoi]|nr:hypothetical protein C8J57DRAFT_256642 [Mycena rebaudengoi]